MKCDVCVKESETRRDRERERKITDIVHSQDSIYQWTIKFFQFNSIHLYFRPRPISCIQLIQKHTHYSNTYILLSHVLHRHLCIFLLSTFDVRHKNIDNFICRTVQPLRKIVNKLSSDRFNAQNVHASKPATTMERTLKLNGHIKALL